MKTDMLAPSLVVANESIQQTKVEVWVNTQSTKNYVPRTKHGRIIKIDPELVHNLASVGCDRKVVAGYYGLREDAFNKVCAENPDVEDAFLTGASKGVAKAAVALDKKIQDGDTIATIFRLKCQGDWIEADKRLGKETNSSNNVQVKIMLPDNGRG